MNFGRWNTPLVIFSKVTLFLLKNNVVICYVICFNISQLFRGDNIKNLTSKFLHLYGFCFNFDHVRTLRKLWWTTHESLDKWSKPGYLESTTQSITIVMLSAVTFFSDNVKFQLANLIFLSQLLQGVRRWSLVLINLSKLRITISASFFIPNTVFYTKHHCIKRRAISRWCSKLMVFWLHTLCI